MNPGPADTPFTLAGLQSRDRLRKRYEKKLAAITALAFVVLAVSSFVIDLSTRNVAIVLSATLLAAGALIWRQILNYEADTDHLEYLHHNPRDSDASIEHRREDSVTWLDCHCLRYGWSATPTLSYQVALHHLKKHLYGKHTPKDTAFIVIFLTPPPPTRHNNGTDRQ